MKQKQDPSLAKIMAAVLFVGAVAYGVVRFSQWLNEDIILGAIEKSAPDKIDMAKELAAKGDTAEAKKALRPIVARVKSDSVTPRALMLMAQLEQESGNTETALALLKRAVDEFPTSPDQPRAATTYGRLLEDLGRIADAKQVYSAVRATAQPALRGAAVAGLARLAERAGELVEARDLYRQAVADSEWDSPEWNLALDGLGRLNVHFIFSQEETPESEPYIVAPGDSLNRIGVRLNTTQGMLIRANGIEDPSKLRPGQRLKHTPTDFRIIIERSTCRLFLLGKNTLFKRYSVGLGMPGDETTLGSYTIGNKMKDPTWYRPGGSPVPPGDPENELGTRWMPLVPNAEGLPTSLGIHGTNKPETVGNYSSLGCARLVPEDVEELYDLVVRGTPVEIVENFGPERVG
ncbi:MAG TPA: tetratricopeptide repeat protein [Candidatus Hydrogenedentes bacterium]|nr:tetratricopeptide repeat protein [Candidatus Hydrogenedentota bacterium]HIJ73651.1 tetratricopeptide repeat protein [Candidatus Hydrogenedentota bacterium]